MMLDSPLGVKGDLPPTLIKSLASSLSFAREIAVAQACRVWMDDIRMQLAVRCWTWRRHQFQDAQFHFACDVLYFYCSTAQPSSSQA